MAFAMASWSEARRENSRSRSSADVHFLATALFSAQIFSSESPLETTPWSLYTAFSHSSSLYCTLLQSIKGRKSCKSTKRKRKLSFKVAADEFIVFCILELALICNQIFINIWSFSAALSLAIYTWTMFLRFYLFARVYFSTHQFLISSVGVVRCILRTAFW